MSKPQSVTTWRITPRDPLVIGDGRGPIPFVTRSTFPLPLPSTVAGLVRATWLEQQQAHDREGLVSPDQAREALERISIRGPFLAYGAEDGKPELLVFPPLDLVQTVDASGEATGLVAASLRRLEPDEGVLWENTLQAVPSILVELRSLDQDDRKTRPLPEGTFWTLEQAVHWALNQQELTGDRSNTPKLKSEQRVHVSIDPDTLTAADAQLFGSSGLRFPASTSLLLEVGIEGKPSWQPGVVTLGGESRPAFVATEAGSALPPFSRYQAMYEERIRTLATLLPQELNPADPRLAALGLRLQLLTHGCFNAGGRPAWLAESNLQGLPSALAARFKGWSVQLEALCLPTGFIPISGWNLQAEGGRGAPRRVRRLVPAGAVYYVSLRRASACSREDWINTLLQLCETLWLQTLSEEESPLKDEYAFEAPPHRDGFGLVLPGVWELSKNGEVKNG